MYTYASLWRHDKCIRSDRKNDIPLLDTYKQGGEKHNRGKLMNKQKPKWIDYIWCSTSALFTIKCEDVCTEFRISQAENIINTHMLWVHVAGDILKYILSKDILLDQYRY